MRSEKLPVKGLLTVLPWPRAALAAGDARELGRLMSAAQQVFDAMVAPASPSLAAPALHRVLEHPALRDLAWGAKGVGSQGDGAAQIVARGVTERDALAACLTADLAVSCLPLTLAPPTTTAIDRR